MKKTIVLALMMLTMTFANAQVLGGLLNDDLYMTKIKLVDEFFDRFNGEEYRPDINPNDSEAKLKNMLVLFNGKMLKSFEDTAFVMAKQFSEKVVEEGIHINYGDSTWIAKATCHGSYKGRPIDFTLYLNVENRRNNLYKWVIAKAEGDLFNLTPSLKKESIMLLPDDHETNFMSLHRITTEKDDYITNYSQKQYCPDQTSVFYSFVYGGLLDINYVKELKFIFMQVPGYVFTIAHFERDNYNSGWLIDSLEQIKDDEKDKFLNYIYAK